MIVTKQLKILGHTVEYINEKEKEIDTVLLSLHIEDGRKNGALFDENYDGVIGTWRIVNPWKELATDMYEWLSMYMDTRPTADSSHPVFDMLEKYDELIEKE